MQKVREFKIENQIIGSGNRTFIIAEVAQAHDGSLGYAHAFIDLAADYGADAIKFQTHFADDESTLDEQFRINFSYKDKTRYGYWKRMEFSEAEWIGLYNHAKDKNIIFLSSAFSLKAIELLEKLDIPAWKIASGEVKNYTFLEKICKTKKPILLSSGMSSFEDIDKSISFLESNNAEDIAIFQCTTEYPTSLKKVGINVIEELKEKYNRPVGLSDHSGDITPSVLAMGMGVSLVEIHIAMNPYQFGPDTIASIKPEDLKRLIEFRDKFQIIKSNPVDKDKSALELKKVATLFGKSLTLNKDYKKGSIIEENMLTLKKPGNGFQEKDINKLIGMKLKKDVKSNRILKNSDIEFKT